MTYHMLKAKKKNLECSSKGDKRFSAMYAKVSFNGEIDSIENIYQSVKYKKPSGKRLDPYIPCKKGEKVDKIIINGISLDPKYLTPFYNLLWIKYLDSNPELVEYAKGFDTFSDMFRGKSINCQADVIERYVKEGREGMLSEAQEFINLIK